MKHQTIFNWSLWMIFFGLAAVFRIEGMTAVYCADEIAVIVNKTVPVQGISRSELKAIFFGETTVWNNRSAINFVLLSDSAAHNQFVETYLDTTSFKFTKYWRNQLFTGKGKMPKTLSAQELITFIEQTEGAIGYVPLQEADQSRVKILTVNQ